MPGQFGDRNGNMGEADQAGHEAIKNAGLHLQCEEFVIVGVQSGVEAALDRREVDSIVFEAWMVSCDDERNGANE